MQGAHDMPPKAGLPPEIADAIEFTAEFRQAMGFVEDPDPDPVTEVPSKEELAHIPEWFAVNAWITAEEYLACFGHSMQPIQTIRHQNTGKNNRWKNKKRDPA
jgi:hypothetical protein